MLERIIGLDVGDKWIGVAVSDELGLLATPTSPPIRRVSWRDDVDAVINLANRWNAGIIVVGLPLNMNASVGPQAQKTLQFVDRLSARTSCPVVTWDERLTTMQAERLLIEQDVRRKDRKKLVDGLSASLMLQAYLDHRRGRNGEDTQMADEEFTGEMMSDDGDEIITLTDEEGHDHEFVVVDVIEVASQEYAILLPIDSTDEEEAEAVILRLEKDADGDDLLVDIESEEEWERVAQAYEQLLDEEDED